MPQAGIPSEQEVLGWFDSLSNWGRWGDDDELGTPNLITPAKTRAALASVQEGHTVSLSRTVSWEPAADVPAPPVHYMVESGEGWATGHKVSSRPSAVATDYIGMIFHGVTVTHVDSLAHFFWNGKTYNGKPAHYVSTGLGATVCSVEQAHRLGNALTLMTTHGRRGVGRALLGSVADRVVRNSPAPTLLLRGATRAATPVGAVTETTGLTAGARAESLAAV